MPRITLVSLFLELLNLNVKSAQISSGVLRVSVVFDIGDICNHMNATRVGYYRRVIRPDELSKHNFPHRKQYDSSLDARCCVAWEIKVVVHWQRVKSLGPMGDFYLGHCSLCDLL